METIKTIYNSPYLYGDLLTQPLKCYNDYFDRLATDHPGWKEVAIRIVQFIVGILVYPFLALLALIGMIFKAFEYVDVRESNEGQIRFFNIYKVRLENSKFSKTYLATRYAAGEEIDIFQTWTLNRQNFQDLWATIENRMQECTAVGRRVFLQIQGDIDTEKGASVALAGVIIPIVSKEVVPIRSFTDVNAVD